MERNIQKNGLVNLAVAVLIFLAGFGVTVFAGSLGGQAASVFLGLGVLVTFISWFQMRPEKTSGWKNWKWTNSHAAAARRCSRRRTPAASPRGTPASSLKNI